MSSPDHGQTPTSAQGISGKRVIITGAATGIGRATAVAFAGLGAEVIVNHWQNAESASETCRLAKAAAEQAGISASVYTVEADMGAADGPDQLFDTALAQLGDVDIVVNNAGTKGSRSPVDYPVAEYDRVMRVNLRGPFLLSRRAIQHYLDKAKPGQVLCVSSVHDTIPLPSDVVYTMSKGGLLMMVKTLAKWAEGGKIRVNAVSPGAVDMPMNPKWDKTTEARQRFEADVPLRRAGEPEDIAAALIFLASDAAAYMTGQTIYVDGGLVL